MIKLLSTKYSVNQLWEIMEVNRSGYYKWLNRKEPNQYQKDRLELINEIKIANQKHPSYGYHRLAIAIRNKLGWIFSDNLVHKCCKYIGIKSSARKCNRWTKP